MKEHFAIMPTPEQKTQLAICGWLMRQHPEVFKHIIKIDNEGVRTIGGHVLATRMGLHKGASDLFIAWPTTKYFGLWLEIKPDGWKGPSGKKQKLHIENQTQFIEKMKLKGYFGKMVTGVDQALLVINSYLKGGECT